MTYPFTSTLARDLQDFLAFKQTLGHPYRRAVFTLRSFDRYVPSTKRARAELGLAATIPFEDAIARTFAWHREGGHE